MPSRPARQSIPRKILLATALAVGVALLVVDAALLIWDRYVFRQEVAEELSTTARVMADSLQAAVSFDDASVATETLAFLASMPEVRLGCIYDEHDRLFAWYPASENRTCPPYRAEVGMAGRGQISTSQPILSQGRPVGQLFLRRSLSDVDRRLFQRTVFLALVTLASLGIALGLSNRIRGSIAAPIVRLAETAKRVSESRDYALRAVKESDGEIGVLVDSFNDMLARIEVQTADLEEAGRLKDEFLAKLSHELRTPLNAVLGWSNMLRTGAVPQAKFQTSLESIERNAWAQLRIIEDLLDISRIATGKLVIEKRPVDMRAIIQGAVEVVQLSADAKQIRIDVHNGTAAAVVLGDADRLQQAVWNLLANSIKFTEAGGAVSVGLTVQNELIHLTVTDTGEGMPPGFVPFAFDPFRQARLSSSGGAGLGLGLSLVKQIVELHGGKVRIEKSAPLEGTSIVADLPRYVGHD
jgi:signal transduction histidine kinase